MEKRIKYEGDHVEFIQKLFTIEFIEQSKRKSKEIMTQLIDYFTLHIEQDDEDKSSVDYYRVNDTFQMLNQDMSNYDVPSIIEYYDFIDKYELRSEVMLNMMIAYVITLTEPPIDTDERFENEVDENEYIGDNIERLFQEQHDVIPLYLKEKITQLLHLFVSEFDANDGFIERDYYYSMRNYYCDFGRFNSGNPSSALFE